MHLKVTLKEYQKKKVSNSEAKYLLYCFFFKKNSTIEIGPCERVQLINTQNTLSWPSRRHKLINQLAT